MSSNLRWYCKLVKRNGDQDKKGLLDNYNDDTLRRKLIIAQETVTTKRKYTVFDDVTHFYKCMTNKFQENEKTFHEIVPSFQSQKPRIDIDIKRSELPEEITDLDDIIKMAGREILQWLASVNHSRKGGSSVPGRCLPDSLFYQLAVSVEIAAGYFVAQPGDLPVSKHPSGCNAVLDILDR